MLKALQKLVKVPSEPTNTDISGVRPVSEQEVRFIAHAIHVADYETLPLRFVNESDLMLWLVRKDPFLSHQDYVTEAQDFMVAHFLTVFTFNPASGKVTAHIR